MCQQKAPETTRTALQNKTPEIELLLHHGLKNCAYQ